MDRKEQHELQQTFYTAANMHVMWQAPTRN
jgi:hypothetical protein